MKRKEKLIWIVIKHTQCGPLWILFKPSQIITKSHKRASSDTALCIFVPVPLFCTKVIKDIADGTVFYTKSLSTLADNSGQLSEWVFAQAYPGPDCN